MPKNVYLRPSGDKPMGQRILSELGMTSEEEILGCLENPYEQPARQIKACLAAGHLGNRTAVPSLIRLLQSEDIEILGAATRALWMIGSRCATRPLMFLANGSKREDVRRCAITALGMLADHRAEYLLRRLLADETETEGIRALAADALLGVRPRRGTIIALTNALRDPSPSVRYSVLNTLGIVAKECMADAIRSHLSDQSVVPGLPPEEGTVAYAAQQALDNFDRRRNSPSDARPSKGKPGDRPSATRSS